MLCYKNNNFSVCTFKLDNKKLLYDVANVGDYIEYKPTATSYTPSTLYGITGTINPSVATGWRVLSKNSDGTINIIPANTGGTLEFNIDDYNVDNETYGY